MAVFGQKVRAGVAQGQGQTRRKFTNRVECILLQAQLRDFRTPRIADESRTRSRPVVRDAMTGASQPTISAPAFDGFCGTPRAISSEPEALCSQGDGVRYWGGLAG